MKALLDLLTEEQDCLRNIKIADENIVDLNKISAEQGLTSNQIEILHYHINRITELAAELPRIQTEIGQALAYYLRINQKEEK